MPKPKVPPSPSSWTDHTVAAKEEGQRVREILRGPLGISGRMLQRLTRANGIRLNGRKAHLERRVREGDIVSARVTPEEDAGLAPVEMPLRIIYEDAELLVIDKPPFLLVHPTSPRHQTTLAHGVAHHFAAHGLRAKVRPVHRIDRDVSGLVLFAKSAHAHAQLDRQLRERVMQREYLALVQGVPANAEGVIDTPIAHHPQHRHLRTVGPRGQTATTRYRVVQALGDAALLGIALETGRTHQIRVHLQHLGHPLLGDADYGAVPQPMLRRPALHAATLSLLQPATGTRLMLEAPLPDDIERLRDALTGR